MKKKTITSSVSLFVVLITAFSIFYFSPSQRTKRATVILYKSKSFSQSEVESAIECVKNRVLKLDHSYLKKIWNDESLTNEKAREYKRSRKDGSNVIVVCSTYHAGSDMTRPKMVFDEYIWILVRDSETDDWRINNHGAY